MRITAGVTRQATAYISNEERKTRLFRLFIAPYGDLDVNRRAKLATQFRRKQSHRRMLAQVVQQDVEINLATPQPTIDRPAHYLFFGGKLGEVEERTIRRANATILIGKHDCIRRIPHYAIYAGGGLAHRPRLRRTHDGQADQVSGFVCLPQQGCGDAKLMVCVGRVH